VSEDIPIDASRRIAELQGETRPVWLPGGRLGPLLPLEAQIERSNGGWRIRLPVRAEQVKVEKRVVVAEEVRIWKDRVPEVARVEGDVHREELVVRPIGRVEVDREGR
jgi:hypothetical protein